MTDPAPAGIVVRASRGAFPAVVLLATLSSCGGGSSGQPARFAPQAQVENRCAAPRSGADPLTGKTYQDVQGTLLDELDWLASWTNDWYLWYGEVDYGNPSTYATAIGYFDVLKTNAVTATGHPRDKFHFTYATPAWEALASANTEVGYGATWSVIAGTPPRKAVVAYTEPGTPATLAATPLARGDQVVTVDGVDFVNDPTQAGVDRINAAMFPAASGGTHTFGFLRQDGSAYTVVLAAQAITSQPVQGAGTVAPGVGYMLFNDHLATAEPALFEAITRLKSAGIRDLVIDMRYNGGGYLVVASELAYMIAGGPATRGKTFELTKFNAKYPNFDPVANAAIAPDPFQPTVYGLTTSPPAGTPLPQLGLARVFVLTGPRTCSASESVMNSLAGIGVQVIQIGSTTCGKPYGFYPRDNCGTTYFTIQFRGVNEKGFGDYTDGFSPQNSSLAVAGSAATLPGCQVADDFAHALGDPAEARLSTALAWISAGGSAACPAPTGIESPGQFHSLRAAEGNVPKSVFRSNRIRVPRPGA